MAGIVGASRSAVQALCPSVFGLPLRACLKSQGKSIFDELAVPALVPFDADQHVFWI